MRAPKRAPRKGTRRPRRRLPRLGRETKCRFCREKATHIDYKGIDTLAKLLTAQGKMFSRKRSGNCARHQRAVQQAVKRSRFIALLPYIG